MELQIRFEIGRDGDVVGRVEAGDAPRKIALIERAYRGERPKVGEEWLCTLVWDTKPGERGGVLLVRPARRVTISWRLIPETGEEIEGLVKVSPAAFRGSVRVYVSDPPPPALVAEAAAVAQKWEAAQARQWAWQHGSAARLIEAFGQPLRLEQAAEEGRISLRFERGLRVVFASDAATVLPTTASGRWRNASDTLEAEFTFDSSPSLTAWLRVGYTFRGSPEVVDSVLVRLPATAQAEVFAALRAATRSPEQIAREGWGDFSADDYARRQIEELRTELRALLGPGKAETVSSSRRETVYEPLSPDERRGGCYYDETVTRYALRVGARIVEGRFCGLSPIRGGTEIAIGRPAPTDTPEAVREELILSHRAEIARLLAEACKPNPPKADTRLHSLTAEEWTARFVAAFGALRAEAEAKWAAEDAAAVAVAHEEWRRYDEATGELEAARSLVSSVWNRATRHGMTVSHPGFGCEINGSSREDMLAEVASLRQWIADTESEISRTLAERGEREFAAKAASEAAVKAAERALADAMSAPATAVPWYLRGVDAAALEQFGRKAGEGFGDRVAGQSLYLPGDRSPVALHFSGGTSRYSTEVECDGLAPLGGGSLVSEVRKHSQTLLAVGASPSWSVRWTEKYDGAPTGRSLANAAGIAHLTAACEDSDGEFSRQGWDGTDGVGPTEKELRAAFGLSAPRPEDRFQPHVRAWAAAGVELLGRKRLEDELEFVEREGTGRACAAFDELVEAAIVRKGDAADSWRERLPRLGGRKGVPTYCAAARQVLGALRAGIIADPNPPTAPKPAPATPPPPPAKPAEVAATLAALQARFGGKRR